MAKARKLAVAVGAMAGVFGGLVGVGGGVLMSPIIANACRWAWPPARGRSDCQPRQQLLAGVVQ